MSTSSEAGGSKFVLGLALAILVILSGCSGSPPVRGQTVTVTDTIDRDCDDRYRSVQLLMDVQIGSNSEASGNTWVTLYHQTSSENYEHIETFSGLSGWHFERNITLNASDFDGMREETVIRATAKRSALLRLDPLKVSVGTSQPISIEPPNEDQSNLVPSFTQNPAKPNRSEPVMLTAHTGNSQCNIQSLQWDVDNDTEFEATGQTVTTEYSIDGTHEIRLKVTNEGGITKVTEGTVFVFHDPDGDGITTAREKRLGTSPFDWDTDGDLFSDRIDPMPTTALIPTGIIHLLLTIVSYLMAFHYRDRLANP